MLCYLLARLFAIRWQSHDAICWVYWPIRGHVPDLSANHTNHPSFHLPVCPKLATISNQLNIVRTGEKTVHCLKLLFLRCQAEKKNPLLQINYFWSLSTSIIRYFKTFTEVLFVWGTSLLARSVWHDIINFTQVWLLGTFYNTGVSFFIGAPAVPPIVCDSCGCEGKLSREGLGGGVCVCVLFLYLVAGGYWGAVGQRGRAARRQSSNLH